MCHRFKVEEKENIYSNCGHRLFVVRFSIPIFFIFKYYGFWWLSLVVQAWLVPLIRYANEEYIREKDSSQMVVIVVFVFFVVVMVNERSGRTLYIQIYSFFIIIISLWMMMIYITILLLLLLLLVWFKVSSIHFVFIFS